MSKFKKGDLVRLRNGCVWLYGQVDKCFEGGRYECSWDYKKRFQRMNEGFPLRFFGIWHEQDIKSIQQ